MARDINEPVRKTLWEVYFTLPEHVTSELRTILPTKNAPQIKYSPNLLDTIVRKYGTRRK